jgi:hypothetical protein
LWEVHPVTGRERLTEEEFIADEGAVLFLYTTGFITRMRIEEASLGAYTSPWSGVFHLMEAFFGDSYLVCGTLRYQAYATAFTSTSNSPSSEFVSRPRSLFVTSRVPPLVGEPMPGLACFMF